MPHGFISKKNHEHINVERIHKVHHFSTSTAHKLFKSKLPMKCWLEFSTKMNGIFGCILYYRTSSIFLIIILNNSSGKEQFLLVCVGQEGPLVSCWSFLAESVTTRKFTFTTRKDNHGCSHCGALVFCSTPSPGVKCILHGRTNMQYKLCQRHCALGQLGEM